MKQAWAAGILILMLTAASQAFGQASDAAAATTAPATGDYDKIQVEAGLFKGGLDGTIESLTEGAKIVLFSSKDPSKRLPISANEIRFTWPAGGDPTNMILTGRVVVDHPQIHVKSEKADWDMVKGILTFTGDPIIKTPQGQEVRGQRIAVNMTDNTFQVYGVVIPEMQLRGAGFGAAAAADPSLLREADVLDWVGLLNGVRAEAAAPPSPGKQVVAQLDQSAQKMITSVPVETLVENKAGLIKQINKVLASPKFYDKAAWNGKQLDKQTQDLLAKTDLAGADLTRANRGLLESAYPGMIAPRKPVAQ
ncbi:MAG TPA: hypothetical protein VMZ06_00520 [Candidatus Bathyarchaeia archaeon]|nr:hypothetical protein [Candidatus Bathyarchaeia archaeon]